METPNEPIDGYTLEYWSVYFTGSSACKPQHYRATYHVNTTWDDHPWGKNSKGGAPFVDEWSIEEEETHPPPSCLTKQETVWYPRGRHEQWQRLIDHVRDDKHIFTSESEALAYLIGKFGDKIENTKRDLIDMQTTVDRLDSRLIGLSKD